MNKINQLGFTLLELMIVIAMTGVLIAIGIPSYRSIVTTNALADISNDLSLSLKRARAEAITSGRDVVVCKSTATNAGSATCGGGDWSKGWLVMADRNQDGDFKEEDNELLWVTNIEATSSITIAPAPALGNGADSFTDQVVFSYTGEIKNSANGSFQLCSGIGTGDKGFPRRTINVSVSGQVHFEKSKTKTENC